MADYDSELPVRSALPGQVAPDDIIVKIGDATNPTTQMLGVDAAGKITVKLDDRSGNGIDSQTLSATQWLQIVGPANGPASPGAAAAFSQLMGGIYNLTPPVLADTQQASLQLDSSGRLLVSTITTDDHNYGVVGNNTLRTAAQIGNATGAADFNYGAVGAQTLRVASQIGNATGAADFNAGATGAQTLRVTANQGAPGTAANGWFVRPTDGTNSQSFTAAGEAKVDVTSTFEDQNWGVVGATTLRTAAEIGNATGAADFNFGTVGAQTLRVASQIGNATGAADFNNGVTGAQTLRVAANLAVGGANVSNTNPVPVFISNSVPGAEVLDYKTAASIAAGSSDTHTYTVPGGETFTLQQVSASGSGMIKVEIQLNGVTKVVLFNSTACPNVDYIFQAPQLVAAAGTVSVIITNRDKQAQDLYSTIEGVNNP